MGVTASVIDASTLTPDADGVKNVPCSALVDGSLVLESVMSSTVALSNCHVPHHLSTSLIVKGTGGTGTFTIRNCTWRRSVTAAGASPSSAVDLESPIREYCIISSAFTIAGTTTASYIAAVRIIGGSTTSSVVLQDSSFEAAALDTAGSGTTEHNVIAVRIDAAGPTVAVARCSFNVHIARKSGVCQRSVGLDIAPQITGGSFSIQDSFINVTTVSVNGNDKCLNGAYALRTESSTSRTWSYRVLDSHIYALSHNRENTLADHNAYAFGVMFRKGFTTAEVTGCTIVVEMRSFVASLLAVGHGRAGAIYVDPEVTDTDAKNITVRCCDLRMEAAMSDRAQFGSAVITAGLAEVWNNLNMTVVATRLVVMPRSNSHANPDYVRYADTRVSGQQHFKNVTFSTALTGSEIVTPSATYIRGCYQDVVFSNSAVMPPKMVENGAQGFDLAPRSGSTTGARSSAT